MFHRPLFAAWTNFLSKVCWQNNWICKLLCWGLEVCIHYPAEFPLSGNIIYVVWPFPKFVKFCQGGGPFRLLWQQIDFGLHEVGDILNKATVCRRIYQRGGSEAFVLLAKPPALSGGVQEPEVNGIHAVPHTLYCFPIMDRDIVS